MPMEKRVIGAIFSGQFDIFHGIEPKLKSSAYEARSRDRYVNLNQRIDADGLQHALGLLDEGIHGEVEILEQIAGWRGFSEAIDSEHRAFWADVLVPDVGYARSDHNTPHTTVNRRHWTSIFEKYRELQRFLFFGGCLWTFLEVASGAQRGFEVARQLLDVERKSLRGKNRYPQQYPAVTRIVQKPLFS
jgi:hypothetical protein